MPGTALYEPLRPPVSPWGVLVQPWTEPSPKLTKRTLSISSEDWQLRPSVI